MLCRCAEAVELVGDGELDGGGGGEAGAGEGGLVDYGAAGPLGGGDVIDFAAEAGGIEAALGVGFGHADEVGHDVGGLARTLRDEDVDAGSGGAGSGARRLDDDFVGGLVGHGDGGDFTDLEASAEEFDA